MCHCICFNSYRGIFVNTFYNILHVYDTALEKNEKEVLTTYAVMIFVSSSDINITMYISS